MTAIHTEQHAGAAFTRRAWWSLLGFVPSFALAFALGEGISTALGYSTVGQEAAPWWVTVLAATPALIVFVLPAVAAVHFGRRAIRRGDPRARLPMRIGLVVAGGFVLTNGISALAVWLY